MLVATIVSMVWYGKIWVIYLQGYNQRVCCIPLPLVGARPSAAARCQSASATLPCGAGRAARRHERCLLCHRICTMVHQRLAHKVSVTAYCVVHLQCSQRHVGCGAEGVSCNRRKQGSRRMGVATCKDVREPRTLSVLSESTLHSTPPSREGALSARIPLAKRCMSCTESTGDK